jgi:hypothetical protein
MVKWKIRQIETPAGNERFCEMAALTPQTILWEIERLSPAGSVVEADTSQSRQNDVQNPLRGFCTSASRSAC